MVINIAFAFLLFFFFFFFLVFAVLQDLLYSRGYIQDPIVATLVL